MTKERADEKNLYRIMEDIRYSVVSLIDMCLLVCVQEANVEVSLRYTRVKSFDSVTSLTDSAKMTLKEKNRVPQSNDTSRLDHIKFLIKPV